MAERARFVGAELRGQHFADRDAFGRAARAAHRAYEASIRGDRAGGRRRNPPRDVGPPVGSSWGTIALIALAVVAGPRLLAGLRRPAGGLSADEDARAMSPGGLG